MAGSEQVVRSDVTDIKRDWKGSGIYRIGRKASIHNYYFSES